MNAAEALRIAKFSREAREAASPDPTSRLRSLAARDRVRLLERDIDFVVRRVVHNVRLGWVGHCLQVGMDAIPPTGK